MNNCYAVLLDTVSIQNYIFSSNKLKENLGASYLVEEIYRTYLACGLSAAIKIPFEEVCKALNSWQNAQAQAPNCIKGFDVGYIGGGNALLFFQHEKLAQSFIKEWTKLLLVRAPGLTTAVACINFPKDPERFKESLQMLFAKLEHNKAFYSPITSLPKHGITAECSSSGNSAETYKVYGDGTTYLSSGTYARVEAAELSKEALESRYTEQLGNDFNGFCFSNELDKLGGIRNEDSHIAIVHIDGNDMGERFREAKTLQEMQQLSHAVDLATKQAFTEVITTTIQRYEDIMRSLGFDSNDRQRQYPIDPVSQKKILPIRPIILGGDDVTFVCDGKLGIYFAKIFIEAFEQEKITSSEKLTACAGVAIIKTKYPFYRGVTLATELCKNAKQERKEKRRSTSFLDFQVSLGGIAGGLKPLRELYFRVPQGSLLYRPFEILSKEGSTERNLDLFLTKVSQLYVKDSLPNNKLNELREVLSLPEEAAHKFVQELRFRDRELPKIEGRQYEERLFEDRVTPYFDMIEIGEYYPDFALKELKNE